MIAAGVTDTVKSCAGGVTVIVVATVLAGPLDGVKVNVTGYVPGGALIARTKKLTGEYDGPVIVAPLGGVKMMPAGCPLGGTVTLAAVKHAFGAIDAVIAWEPPPAVRLSIVGTTDGVKSGSVTLTMSVMFLLMFDAGSLMFSVTVCIPAVAPLARTVNGTDCAGGIGLAGGDDGVTMIPGGDVNVSRGVPV